MKKKILLVTGAAALAVLSAPAIASADENYPPTSNDPTSVQVLPAVAAQAPAAEPAASAELPKTGGNDTRLLQIGGVTLLVGGALVASTLRRQRHNHNS